MTANNVEIAPANAKTVTEYTPKTEISKPTLFITSIIGYPLSE